MRNIVQHFQKTIWSAIQCFLLIVITSAVCTVPENFGKTHFIKGLAKYPPADQKTDQKPEPQLASCFALFSPNQEVFDKLAELIENEQSQISIAIYTLTDMRIAKELIKAKKRGVHIEVITDRSSPLDRSTKIGLLHANNIPIFIYQPPLENNVQKGLMHNKFVLFFNNGAKQEKIIWHGSFNFSYAGYHHNCESVIILRESAIFQQFETEFQQIKRKSILYQPQINS